MSASISDAAEQQTEKARHVSGAVEDANQITHAAASSAQEISSAVEQLSELAQGLQAIASQFKVGSELEAKINADNKQGQAVEAEAPELIAEVAG
jgi:ABC-type transporter Mla subunit MlaD